MFHDWTASTFQSTWAYLALGACLSICKHLEWITSSRSGVSSRPHRVLFEVMACCVFPMISILFRMFVTRTASSQLPLLLIYPTVYIVAPHRYVIVEDFGCASAFKYSTVAVALRWVPVIVVSLISFIFAGEVPQS